MGWCQGFCDIFYTKNKQEIKNIAKPVGLDLDTTLWEGIERTRLTCFPFLFFAEYFNNIFYKVDFKQ